ncbi:hypothetical protein B0H16DRAFT_1593397 [Mycena metata]|uniref:Uncharacterized protein n=1 Tax=Mycena metata TaxID=1033252 RepID=A0AAD7H7Q6_9AGAR|nr:hypothetical protein B0H16DRAFT_1619471 [Mycena metata]KAJ7725922.1 hypothetical protein B0H16DRAFT_1593397 [Mycena metata]
MRPLPSPPTSASLQVPNDNASIGSSDDSDSDCTPSQSFAVRLPIGVERSIGGAPRLLKARRREGRIFTHSPASSMSSIDSVSSFGGVISAEFWMAPEDTASVKVVSLTDAPNGEEMKTITPTTPKMKPKSKPANIIIPRNVPKVAVVSPTSPPKSPSPAIAFPTSPLEAVTVSDMTPLSPFYPFSPLSPNRRIQSPNARVRKLAKLTRTLGENVPIELVFPSGSTSSTPTVAAAPSPAQKPTKRARLRSKEPAAVRTSLLGPRATARLRPAASPAWPLTPTPDCTFDPEVHTQTAVGLHYALGMNSLRAHAPAVVPAAPAMPTSPPPFSNTFTMDDVSWERARQAVMGPRAGTAKKTRRVLGGVGKAVPEANGRGTWRKKENTWSGEWNVEDMEELQVQLRRLRR